VGSERLGFLANLFNSIIIEIYGDIIRVSHGFSRIDMLFFIADTCNSAPGVGLDDITGFIAPVISDSLELSTLFIGQSQ